MEKYKYSLVEEDLSKLCRDMEYLLIERVGFDLGTFFFLVSCISCGRIDEIYVCSSCIRATCHLHELVTGNEMCSCRTAVFYY